MKKNVFLWLISSSLFFSQAIPVYAITKAEVEAVGKETAAGNVLIWFLCAIAFLKVSQKVDSFMGSIGIQVGNTGSSMLSELMIAAKTITTVKNGVGNLSNSQSGFSRSKASPPFLGGMIGGQIPKSVQGNFDTGTKGQSNVGASIGNGVNTRTTNTAESQRTAATFSHSENHTKSQSNQESSFASTANTRTTNTAEDQRTTATFSHSENQTKNQSNQESSLASMEHTRAGNTVESKEMGASSPPSTTYAEKQKNSGTFADVEATKKKKTNSAPSSSSSFSDTGKTKAAQNSGLIENTIEKGSYGKNTATVTESAGVEYVSADSVFSSVQKGTGDFNSDSYQNTITERKEDGSQITGREVSSSHPEGIPYAMYQAEHYVQPEGDYETITEGGQTWYKQYARDTIEYTPYLKETGEIDYHETTTKKLPKQPARKE